MRKKLYPNRGLTSREVKPHKRGSTSLKVEPQQGFTLIEVLVAATIVSVLATIGVVSYQVTGRQSRDARRRADLEQIRVALEMIRADCDTYPTTDPPWGNPWSYPCAPFNNTYMEEVPQDPKDPDYVYKYTSATGDIYSLCAYLENGPSQATTCGNCDSEGSVACNYEITNP